MLWRLVRSLEDPREASKILASGFPYTSPRVRTMGGSFRPVVESLLPGVVVPPDGSRDEDVAVDTAYHRAELEVLRLLGAGQTPTVGFPFMKDPLALEYRLNCIGQYIQELAPDGPTPQWDKMDFDRDSHVGPLEPLRHLSDDGRAAFVEELIKSITDWGPWTLKHATQRQYPQREFPSPAVWAISNTEGCGPHAASSSPDALGDRPSASGQTSSPLPTSQRTTPGISLFRTTSPK